MKKTGKKTFHPSEGYFEALIDLLPCYLTLQDKDFKIFYANSSFINDFGNRQGDFCHAAYKGARGKCRSCPAEKSFKDKKSHFAEDIIETLDGKVYSVILYSVPIMDDTGEVDAVMELAVNISGIKDMKKELSSLGLAVAFMSHGIKNILEGLEGGAYLVDEGIHDDDMALVKRGWAMVNNNITDISIMVQNLLYASKKRSLQIEKIRVDDIVKDSVNLFRKKAASLGVDIHVNIERDMPPVKGDRNSLRRLMNNLITNALEACAKDKDEELKRVAIRAGVFNEMQIYIEVEDNGIGMDEATKKRIFREFFSTKGTEGTGLGLAVVHKIVKEHRGKIEVESSPGIGAVFRTILSI